MKVWELHRDLANSLGDPVLADSGSLPNGVRFSKVMRDGYITRAILLYYQSILKGIVGLERTKANAIVSSLFPNYRIYETLAGTYVITTVQGSNPAMDGIRYFESEIDINKIFFVLGLHLGKEGFGLPIPFKSSVSVSSGLRNQRISQPPDLYAEITGKPNSIDKSIIRIYDAGQEILGHEDLVNIEYVPYPSDIATLQPNDNYSFEPAHLPQILKTALQIGLIESQEIENVERYIFNEAERQ